MEKISQKFRAEEGSAERARVELEIEEMKGSAKSQAK